MTHEPPTKQPQNSPPQTVQRAGDGDTSTGTTSSPTLVNTRWFVDYNKIAGVTTKIPARQSDDQLVVDELRIWPNSEDAPHLLEGGNMARSGAVDLGSVAVPKGSGKVSAAVRYGKKKQFDIQINITPVPARADAKTVADLKSKIADAVSKEIDHRGDYAAVASKVANDFKDALPDRTIAISIRPLGGSKAGASYDAPAKSYAATKDTRFRVAVNPSQTQDRSVTWSESKGGEVDKSRSDTSGVSTTSDINIEKKQKILSSVVTSFANNATTAIHTVFKEIEGQMLSNKYNGQTEWSKITTWNAGIGEAKEDKREAADKADDSKPSLTHEIVGGAKAVGGWLVSKISGVAKRIPVLSSAVSFMGDLWDSVSGRGSISRNTEETDKKTNGNESSISANSGREFSTLDDVISEWKHSITTDMQLTVEKTAANHLGISVTNQHNDGATNKDTSTKSSSGTTVTHELGAPELEIEEMT